MRVIITCTWKQNHRFSDTPSRQVSQRRSRAK